MRLSPSLTVVCQLFGGEKGLGDELGLQSFLQPSQYSCEIIFNFMILESRHSNAQSRQDLGSLSVILESHIARWPIKLNHDSSFATEKVCDIESKTPILFVEERILPKELEVQELPVSYSFPENAFSVRFFFAADGKFRWRLDALLVLISSCPPLAPNSSPCDSPHLLQLVRQLFGGEKGLGDELGLQSFLQPQRSSVFFAADGKF